MPNTSKLNPGEICFAKVKGFPHWPARINVLPSEVKIPRGKFPIFFYGTHEVCFLNGSAIYPYEKYKDKYKNNRNNSGFNKGCQEMLENPAIYQLGIDERAIQFLAQFYKFSKVKAKQEAKVLSIKVDNKPLVNNSSDGISELDTESSVSIKQELGKSNSTSQKSEETKSHLERDFNDSCSTTHMADEENKDPSPQEVALNNTDVLAEETSSTSSDIQFVKTLSQNNVPITDESNYQLDFSNLLLDIRNYAWSTNHVAQFPYDQFLLGNCCSALNTHHNNGNIKSPLAVWSNTNNNSHNKRKDGRQKLKKQRLQSKIRMFFPWFHPPRNAKNKY